MASFVIEGGHSLSGDIYPQGAKNEVLQIICATLLTAEEVTVHNIPDILDVNNLIQLMRDMGVNVSKKGIDTYSFQAANVDFAYLESDEFLKRCSSLRSSSTPSMVSRLEAIPSIFAPMRFSIRHSCCM